MAAAAHPDMEYVPITAAMEGRMYRGPDGVRQFLRALELDWESFRVEPQEFYEFGERVLVLGTWHARGRPSGLELTSQPGGWVVTVRDGLIFREAFGVGDEELAGHPADPA